MLLLDEVRLTRDAARYGFAVGKVRVLQTRTLDRAAFERLLDAADFAECKRLLSDTPYGRYLDHATTTDEVEHALDDALEGFYAFLRSAELPEAVTRYFRIRYDYTNLKAVAKARALGAPLDGLLVAHGTVPPEALLADAGDLPEGLASVVARLGLSAATSVPDDATAPARTLANEAEREPLDALTIDTTVDRAMFAEMVRIAREAASRFLLDYARLSVDLANAKTLLRATHAGLERERIESMLIEGGTIAPATLAALAEEGHGEVVEGLPRFESLIALRHFDLDDPGALDAALESVSARAIRRGRQGQPGPEPVICYVLGQEFEVAALRVLLVGTLSGLERETIRRHMAAAIEGSV